MQLTVTYCIHRLSYIFLSLLPILLFFSCLTLGSHHLCHNSTSCSMPHRGQSLNRATVSNRSFCVNLALSLSLRSVIRASCYLGSSGFRVHGSQRRSCNKTYSKATRQSPPQVPGLRAHSTPLSPG